MAIIKPFRAIRYNKRAVRDLSLVVAPPYDLIDSRLQHQLYERHPLNIVRLILGKIEPEDDELDNRYTRAASTFIHWQEKQYLLRDQEPSLYYYLMEFKEKRKKTSRRGFICLARLEDFTSGAIYPHERTFAGAKIDRLRLIQECEANLCAIFSLYSDPEREIQKIFEDGGVEENRPLYTARDDQGVIHRLWKVSDPELISRIQKRMEGKTLIIADGHHRYETALNYRDQYGGSSPRSRAPAPYNYIMMYLANLDEEGLVIKPSHRLIYNLAKFENDTFLKGLKKYFTIKEYPFRDRTKKEVRKRLSGDMSESGHSTNAYGMVLKGDNHYYLLINPQAQEEGKELDVMFLHQVVIKHMLGIEQDSPDEQTCLRYVKDENKVFREVEAGRIQIAFLLNPTRIDEIRRLVHKGEILPYKSTFFYPKPLSGLLINKLDE